MATTFHFAATMLRSLASRACRMRSWIIKSLCARTPGLRGLASVTNPEVKRFLDEKTVERKNGERERRLFSDAEYERRLANLRCV